MYSIDYCGQRLGYCSETGEAQERYRPGTPVTLYFVMVATDFSYTFLLDGNPISPDYDHDKGFVIRFVMPEHDVKLQCITRNTMVLEQE